MIIKLAHCPKDVAELRRKTRGNPKPSDSVVAGQASDTFSLVTLQSHRLHAVDRSLDFLGIDSQESERQRAEGVAQVCCTSTVTVTTIHRTVHWEK